MHHKGREGFNVGCIRAEGFFGSMGLRMFVQNSFSLPYFRQGHGPSFPRDLAAFPVCFLGVLTGSLRGFS